MEETKTTKRVPKRSAVARFNKLQAYKTTRNYKRATTTKRKHDYYTTGKGSEGFVIRVPRAVRHIRAIRENASESFNILIGDDDPKTKKVIRKPFTQAVVGALDAYANELLRWANKIADPEGKKKEAGLGVKLRKRHLLLAHEFILYFSRH
jgi:hypothetical protein